MNWDTKLGTAISDLEVEQKEVQSNLYYIKYKIDGENTFLTIATTRPETMLGDTAVAVNPNDVRYKKYIGKKIIVPVVKRKVNVLNKLIVNILCLDCFCIAHFNLGDDEYPIYFISTKNYYNRNLILINFKIKLNINNY